MKKARVRAIIRGRVQGVYFRDFTRTWARRLGLCGYVRNLADGTLEAVAEGEKEALHRLLDQLHIGPPSAQVEELKIEWSPAQGQFQDFEVRYV